MSGHSKFANIKHKKERNDAAKGKIFTVIGREIAVAVKEGGADPANNSKLRDVIAKAKANNMPNDTIDRGIKKAAGDANSVNYETLTYEGYGPNGVAIIVDTLTDNKNRMICDRVLSKGTVNCSLVSPREVFRVALEYHAVHILLIHNHPSGDASPSRQDIEITKHLAELCGMMQLPLIDHIIVGDNCYVSFRESGLLK